MSTVRKASEFPSTTDLAANRLLAVNPTSGQVCQADASNVSSRMMDFYSPYVTDFDAVTDPGLYMVDGTASAKNGPAGMSTATGLLEVFRRRGTQTVFQRVTNVAGQTAQRVHFGGAWKDWVKVTS